MDMKKDHQDVVTLDVHATKDLLDSSGYNYLDVRTVEEFNKSHVENAINVPYLFSTEEGRVKNPDFVNQVEAIYKSEDHLIVACNAGGRSSRAWVDLHNSERIGDDNKWILTLLLLAKW
ncbi:rhodanese/cell cycle control phosphatase superfamily protein [Medicago truncatula]|nr:rhodanese/cell cycle control phosphatase superfamily protein [Medicago truncatula]